MSFFPMSVFFFFFNDTATTEIYTLSLHDALPISPLPLGGASTPPCSGPRPLTCSSPRLCSMPASRSEEHTSELQSQSNLVCRLLLEKKKKQSTNIATTRGVHAHALEHAFVAMLPL